MSKDYDKTYANLQKDWNAISGDFDRIMKDFNNVLNDQETDEDFSRRVKKQKAVEMRVFRRLWIVDSNGVVTLTKLFAPPKKKTLIQKIKGWFK